PSPQLANDTSYTPNGQTLLVNPGDWLQVNIRDVSVPAYTKTVASTTYKVPAGLALQTTVNDLTSHQTGTMVASAANGFMDTNPTTCSGNPFNFTAEYSSASAGNGVPWAALEGGVLMEDELGHFEVCNSVSSPLPQPGDADVYQVCNGGSEGQTTTPEQGCSLSTFNCPGATTEDGLACPAPPGGSVPNAGEGLNCEYSNALCMPAGPRPISNDGSTTTADWPVAGCQDNYIQNGDLDFDGTSYQPDWPDGQWDHPTSFEYIGPFSNGQTYPQVQIETDLPASEGFCNVTTGLGCTVPPVGASFYPFWTLGRVQVGRFDQDSGQGQGGNNQGDNNSAADFGSMYSHSACAWNFGNVIPGTTVNTLGGDSEYGTADLLRYGGTAISPVLANPQLNCGGRH
ncbi:MAG: hypothetical protein ACREN4_00280, partial [Candidatus Dormibacteria bacterium]